jgi:hypothetical protein
VTDRNTLCPSFSGSAAAVVAASLCHLSHTVRMPAVDVMNVERRKWDRS